MALLNGGGQAARDAPAVAAHDEGLLGAVLGHVGGVHGVRVLGSQFEDLTDLDAARKLKRLAAQGAGIAFSNLAELAPGVYREIMTKLGTHEMEAVLVGTDHPSGNVGQAGVGGDLHAFGKADGAHGALDQARVLHLVVGKRLEAADKLACLKLVDLVIAGDEEHPNRTFGVLAAEGLDGCGFLALEELSKLGDGVHAGGCHFLHGIGGVHGGVRLAAGSLGVGSVTAGAIGDLGLAGVGQNHELLGAGAADFAGVGLDDTITKAHALGDVDICLAHQGVGCLKPGLVGIEAVGVLHNELAGAQQAETRTALVAELKLNMVKITRKVLVGAQLVLHQVGDDLFVRGTKAELVAMTVGKAHHLVAVYVPTPAATPQVGVLNEGHQNLLRLVGVHLLAHDVLDFMKNAHAQRKEGVQARSFLADHAGTHQQLGRSDILIAGSFLQSGRIQLGHAQNCMFTH